jgi:hypothetical protein
MHLSSCHLVALPVSLSPLLSPSSLFLRLEFFLCQCLTLVCFVFQFLLCLVSRSVSSIACSLFTVTLVMPALIPSYSLFILSALSLSLRPSLLTTAFVLSLDRLSTFFALVML